jgi:antirestriction protein ArdC
MRQYQQVTDRIVAMLEAGTRPWNQDWSAGGGRPLRHDGTPYRGANVLNLWAAGMARGFASQHWMTYKRAAELGGQVRKGARSESAFYVGTVTRTEERDGEEIDRTIPFLKAYCVFNADEIEGLPGQYYFKPEAHPLADGERLPAADDWIARTGARIVHGGGRAYYHREEPTMDTTYEFFFTGADGAEFGLSYGYGSEAEAQASASRLGCAFRAAITKPARYVRDLSGLFDLRPGQLIQRDA